MFPKKGKFFPDGTGRAQSDVNYAGAIAVALREALGDTHQASKIAMRWTGANERTVKNWFSGACGPSGPHLISLISQSDTVFEVFLRLAGREQLIAAKRLIDARDKLREMLRQIEVLTDEHD